MAAATVRPEKKATINHRHIPTEIVEEILLHLPVKSVLRFSSVSKSWRSMISQPGFIKRYGAVSGREERIVISPSFGDVNFPYLSCPLSSIWSNQPIEDATKIVSPFMETPYLYILACCDELWCVKVGASLFLWNPSMNTYKKLADSSPRNKRATHCYGLGYDCVDDDYKIVKLTTQTTQLYSLRKDSWRDIKPLIRDSNYGIHEAGVFVSGALHWMDNSRNIIVYFDLTTEMFGEVAPPAASIELLLSYIAVGVLRRKLCAYLNNYTFNNFNLWVMEDYGVDKPWTKLYEIQPANGIPDFPYTGCPTIRPLYLYDNGDLLIEIKSLDNNWNIFLYRKGDVIPEETFCRDSYYKILRSYVYVESLVSPVMLSTGV